MNANFQLLDTAVGDRVLNAAAIAAILAAGSPIAVAASTISSSGLATLNSLKVDTGTKTAAAVAGAATLNKNAGVVTSEALTTAAGADYVLTLANSDIAAGDQVHASVGNGTNTAGTPNLASITVSAGQAVITVQNIHASAALNGTLTISFLVVKA